MAGGRLKILNPHRRINALKTPPGHFYQVCRETLTRIAPLKNRLRLRAFPALNRHGIALLNNLRVAH